MHNLFRTSSFLLIVAFVFVALSCSIDDDPPRISNSDTNFKVFFDATWGEETFALDKNFVLSDGTPIRLTRLRHFISDPMSEAFIQDTSVLINYGLTGNKFIQMKKSPAYETISLGIGVDSISNATNPSQYTMNHPLANQDEYWAVWESYMFLKVEGRADMDRNGTYERSFTYHTGMDEFYSTLSFPYTGRDIRLSCNVEKIFDGLDLAVDTLTHTNPSLPEQVALSKKVTDNFINAFE